jgi:integrase
LPIQKLRPVNLSEFYATLLRSGLAPRTVGHVHRVTHRALDQAKQWDVVKDNPAASVSPPRVTRKEVVILQPAEAKAPLRALEGKWLYMIAAMALATGMRRNELLALRWQDVDLDAACVRVRVNLEQTAQHGIRLEELKTAHSRRTIRGTQNALEGPARATHGPWAGQGPPTTPRCWRPSTAGSVVRTR